MKKFPSLLTALRELVAIPGETAAQFLATWKTLSATDKQWYEAEVKKAGYEIGA
jgi:hypothetical protein